MKVTIATMIICLAMVVIGHAITMVNISVNTDGDCDSAIITVFGHDYLYGANGHEVD